MRNKNILILVLVLLAIAVVALANFLIPKQPLPVDAAVYTIPPTAAVTTAAPTEVPTEEPTASTESIPEETELPAAPAETADAAAEPTATPQPAAGYVLVNYATGAFWLPLPETEDYTYPLTQMLPDGTVVTNTIHVMPNGVYMESSTCDNQDCVDEGEVTLENKDTRILANWILCLPNQVTLQLYTPEEILAAIAAQGE